MKYLLNIKTYLKKTKIANIYHILRKYIKIIYERNLSDEKFLNIKFIKVFGKELNKENPETFNEKLQWLKLYWRDNLAEICSDKYEVRKYIKSKRLEYLLNDLIAVYDSVDEVDLQKLPDKFVLKCTHGSGCNIICDEKNKLNWIDTKVKLRKWMKTNYYWSSREWVYKNINPRIICEKYIEDNVAGELLDYKIFCFNGIPSYIMVITDRFSSNGLRIDFFDTQWKHFEFERDHPKSGKEIIVPIKLDLMLDLAKILSKKFPFVRVDFYNVNEKIFFGELTFFPGGGFERFQPEEIDYEFGKKLILPNKKRGN